MKKSLGESNDKFWRDLSHPIFIRSKSYRNECGVECYDGAIMKQRLGLFDCTHAVFYLLCYLYCQRYSVKQKFEQRNELHAYADSDPICLYLLAAKQDSLAANNACLLKVQPAQPFWLLLSPAECFDVAFEVG